MRNDDNTHSSRQTNNISAGAGHANYRPTRETAVRDHPATPALRQQGYSAHHDGLCVKTSLPHVSQAAAGDGPDSSSALGQRERLAAASYC